MLQNWDGRFFFPEWNTALVDRLLVQQEELKSRGVDRQIMILVDDVIMNGRAAEQISNLGMRGRHFNVSLMACAVSYTTLPKKFRRSLDALLVFSCPMTGDMQILTWEFSRRASMARFALDSLEEHQCLVLETLQKQSCSPWPACSRVRSPKMSLLALVGPGKGQGRLRLRAAEAKRLPRFPRQIHREPVQQKRAPARIVANRRHVLRLRLAQTAHRDDPGVAVDLVRKVHPQVLDELALRADAGVADAGHDPAVAVERAQQVHQVRL